MPNIFRRAGNFLRRNPVIGAVFPQNVARQARPYLDQATREGERAYTPYIAQGREVDPMLQQRYGQYLGQEPMDEYQQMSQDPSGLINALMNQYQESPFFQRKRNQALGAARSSAAAGGYAGSPYDQENQMQLADILSSGDMQQWLENNLGVQRFGLVGRQALADKGLQGMQGISGRGFAASSALGDYLGSNLGQRAGLEGGQIASRNAQNQALLSALLSAGAGAAGGAQGASAAQALSGASYGAPGSYRWGR